MLKNFKEVLDILERAIESVKKENYPTCIRHIQSLNRLNLFISNLMPNIKEKINEIVLLIEAKIKLYFLIQYLYIIILLLACFLYVEKLIT